MATCTECVHVETCRYYTNELAKANGIPLKLEEVERLLECGDCENFKDRSRFVELPCKVGDRLYVPMCNSVFDYEVIGFHYKSRGKQAGMYILYQQHMDRYTGRIKETFLGKTIFLTSEEAEQALKERETE